MSPDDDGVVLIDPWLCVADRGLHVDIVNTEMHSSVELLSAVKTMDGERSRDRIKAEFIRMDEGESCDGDDAMVCVCGCVDVESPLLLYKVTPCSSCVFK